MYARFQDIPQFTRRGFWECDFSLDRAVRWIDQNAFNLNPDFQRGHVWMECQQVAWIEFFLRGGTTGRVLYFNDPGFQDELRPGAYSDAVIVDGLQRLTAVRRFVGNEIKVFGSLFSQYTDTLRMSHTIKLNVNNLKTRREVLRWYLEMNEGGTPHTNSELARVKGLLLKETAP